MSGACLVTGAAGFIGSHLVDRLLALGRPVAGVDNLVLGRRSNLAAALRSERFKFQHSDVNAYEQLLAFAKPCHEATPFATLWHLAANSDIQAGGKDPEMDLHATFLTTHHALRLARELNIPQFILASTSAIYGTLPGPLTEEAGPCFPISNYGAMKLASEAALSAALEQQLKQGWIFRFPNVVGSRATHGALYDFVRKLRQNPDELEVLGNGAQEKPYLHVTELVDSMLHVWQHTEERLNCFNIAPLDSASTVRSMAEATVRHVSPGARIRYTGGDRGWVGDVPKFQYSITKLQGTGWSPRLSSDQAVERAIQEIAAENP